MNELHATLPAHSEVGRRPERSRVPHGSPSCADYGCRRAECLSAARRARSRRRADRAAGHRSHVDSAPAAAHVTRLREAGMSAGDIAALSGVSDTLIRRLLRPDADRRPRRILRPTEEALLGTSAPGTRTGPRVPGLTPAADAAARLQQLSERGWPTAYMARKLGTSVYTLAEIRYRRRRHIGLRLDQMIRLLHQNLMNTTPANRGIPRMHVLRARAAATRSARPDAVTGSGPA
ncbi:hypothetical protein ACR820_34635 [Streptomyces netropsis]